MFWDQYWIGKTTLTQMLSESKLFSFEHFGRGSAYDFLEQPRPTLSVGDSYCPKAKSLPKWGLPNKN